MLKLNRRAMIALAAAATAAQTAVLTPALAEDAATPAAAPKDFSIGAADAKVKIVEYASFTCPHCANFHATVFGELKKNYIDTGKAHFTLREVYFDRYGLWAAMIARCGGDMRYFGIHDMLFAKQTEWTAAEDPAQVVENLKAIGLAAGIDQTALEACMNDQGLAEAMIAQSEANMTADDVKGTPTILINGTKYSNMSYDELAAIIDAELAK